MTDNAPGAATGQGTEGTPAGAASATPQTPASWYQGADELTTGYIQNKGWDNPLKAVESYKNLEKLMGADKAGNTVILPKPDASPEELGKFYDRLGRPQDANGYNIKVPEGVGDAEFAKTAGSWFHELGLTQKQGEQLAAKWNDHIGGLTAAQEQQKQAAFDADNKALLQEWGAAHTQNLAAAQAAARGLGLNDKTIDGLQAALGHKGTMELLYKIGSKMGESDFVTGDKTEKFGSALSPAQAKAEIQTKMQDKNWASRYLSGDATAKAEMQRLMAFAYPE